MDSSFGYLLKRDGEERDMHYKESEFCGPLHKAGDCNYINCSFTVDHYHCPMCGSGAVEASQALSHIRSSATCRRDTQFVNEPTSSLYNAFYGGLTTQNSLCSSSYSGFGQLDSYQWHPSMPVDKMAICGPQLSPCFSAPNNSRIPIDPSLCSPIIDIYSKVTGPVKDLVTHPAKSTGTPLESQPWFYNNQSMQVYKYVDQTPVPQVNFLLLDPSGDPKEGPYINDIQTNSYANKSECSSSHRELKESYIPFYNPQNMQPVSSDDSTSLFNLQIQDENLTSKHTDIFSSVQVTSSVCPQECNNKNKDSSCCMLMGESSGTQSADISSFTQFEAGHISDGDHSSSGSESDIIVEDTSDELSGVAETEMSTIETIKCSLLQEVENVTRAARKDSENFPAMSLDIAKPCAAVKSVSIEDNVRCGVCNDHSPGSVLTQLGTQLPLTSASHSPVLMKLSQLVNLNASEVIDTLGGLLCQRCLKLIDVVDELESQLESARQNLLQMLKVTVKCGGPILPDDTPIITTECGKNASLIEDNCRYNVPSDQMIMNEEELVESFSEKETTNVEQVTKESQNNDSSQLRENLDNQCFLEDRNSPDIESRNKIPENAEKFVLLCNQCSSGFSSSAELNTHLAVHKQSDAKFLCEICGRRLQYRHQHQIDHHLSQHFPLNRFVCTECNRSFKSNRALKEHSKVHTGDRPFSCPNCERRFAHSSNMRAHFKICSGDLPFRCEKCNAGFSESSRLDRHVALTHTGLADFKCSQCNRTFGKLSDYRTHQRVHSTVRSYTCQVCDRSYKSLSNLNHHSKTHRKEKPFNCGVCGQSFVRKDNWESHALSHKGERPFKCTECPKAFWSKDNLLMHTKRHAGTHKKNKCPICEKTFSQKLSVHMRTHTGDRPYRCRKCDKAFSTGSSLNKHVLLKHSNSEMPSQTPQLFVMSS